MNIATPESLCYVSPCGDLVLEDPVSQEIIDSSSPDHVASRIDLLYSTQYQWINGHRIPATHTKMLHLVVCMSALVVPAPKIDIILWLSKIADQGYYRFSGDKYEMNFRYPSTGHSFTALRNEKLFYILNLQSANQQSASGKEPSACNFMQQVHLDSRLHFSRANIDRAQAIRKLHFVLGHPSDYTFLCTRWIINVVLTISTSVKTLQYACNSWDL